MWPYAVLTNKVGYDKLLNKYIDKFISQQVFVKRKAGKEWKTKQE